MKIKTLKLLFFVLVTTNVFSQTEKGTFLIGLNTPLSFSSSNEKTTTNFGTSENSNSFFTFSPKVGYAVIDNLFLGLDVTLGFSNNENGVTESNTTNYFISPFVKYYYPLKKDFNLFGEFQYGLGETNSEINNVGIVGPSLPIANTQEFNSDGQNLRLAVGLGYFVTKNFNIELAVAYRNTSFDTESEFNNNSIVINNFGASVGFSLFL